MSKEKAVTGKVKVRANYDLSSELPVTSLWGVNFEKTDKGYIAELPKDQALEMSESGRVSIL